MHRNGNKAIQLFCVILAILFFSLLASKLLLASTQLLTSTYFICSVFVTCIFCWTTVSGRKNPIKKGLPVCSSVQSFSLNWSISFSQILACVRNPYEFVRNRAGFFLKKNCSKNW